MHPSLLMSYSRANVAAGKFFSFFRNLGHIPQIRAARAAALMISRLDGKQTRPRRSRDFTTAHKFRTWKSDALTLEAGYISIELHFKL